MAKTHAIIAGMLRPMVTNGRNSVALAPFIRHGSFILAFGVGSLLC